MIGNFTYFKKYVFYALNKRVTAITFVQVFDGGRDEKYQQIP